MQDRSKVTTEHYAVFKQELSYRKQIARQLPTQYVDGINTNPVTLKSRLRVTKDHWKQNHWIGHTRLTISRVIWRWIFIVTLKCWLEVTKVIENGTNWKIWYGFLFTFHSNYGRIFCHFGDIQRQRVADFEMWVRSFKVIENCAVR